MNEFYKNNIDHIFNELIRIDLMLHLQVLRFRKQNHLYENPDKFQGLYISEQEINQLLEAPKIESGWLQQSDPDNPEFTSLMEEVRTCSKLLADKVKKSIEEGTQLNLVRLAHLYGLSAPEVDILLICLVQQIDAKYEKLFAWLNNDITRKHPTINLVLDLISQSAAEKFSFRDFFSPYAPLFKYHLLEFLENEQINSVPFLSRQLKLNDRIAGYLLESQFIDHELESAVELCFNQRKLSDLNLPEPVQAHLTEFIQWYREGEELVHQNILFSFFGPYGASKQTTAEAVCSEIGLPLLIFDLETALNLDKPFRKIFELAFRESLLVPAAIFFKNIDILLGQHDKADFQLKLFFKIVNENSWFSFFSSRQAPDIQGQLSRQRFIPVEFPIPDYAQRKKHWQLNLNSHHSLAEDVDLNALANKFNFTNGQIRDAIATASNRAQWRSPSAPQISVEDLYLGCQAQSNQKLKTLAQKLKPKYHWQDIVLPSDQMRQLQEITNYIKYKQVVYGDWGFGRKLSLGKGLNVLFSGPSGTGKTMAAEIMANELKLDLYKIDLSTVVSKYIGETEKNLAKIFMEAETSNAILFFDEADALFGKRSEVKDSHDRYANIEIGYLLQKMDEYRGMVILATNMRKNMDEAFVRRMHFTVEFPFPEENYRLRIWRNIFPKETPLNKKIDFKFLARKFKISGGNIKNIAVAAAFYAADDGQVVNMRHIILGTRREFQKMGKLCVKADFEGYYDLIQQ
jgi:SpoVK/Ycf46/Vps4 family AAA+-type ATPase